jgi:hypothetical protein
MLQNYRLNQYQTSSRDCASFKEPLRANEDRSNLRLQAAILNNSSTQIVTPYDYTYDTQ